MANDQTKVAPQGELDAKQEVKKEIIEFVKMITWFLILFLIITTYVVEGYEVQGPSMRPTLVDRERILVLKLPHTLSRLPFLGGIEALKASDVVVFDSPVEKSKRYVKRVIAKGPQRTARKTVAAHADAATAIGQTSKVRFDRGAVYVNNKRIQEPYLTDRQRDTYDSYADVDLQPGTYYVLGDNRGVSKDSRRFGAVDDECIIGKAIICIWPPKSIRIIR
ncbi:MAG: signal peptidase I [Nitrospiraceae bacterium]|nr:signal peptidase I [Nitrospiraceae bacterium]